MANKKLARYLEDIESTERKIAELKEHLAEVKKKQKLDEDAEIIKSIRAKRMNGWELLELLDNIQNGLIVFQPEETEALAGTDMENEQVQEDAPESEDVDDESK
ncbi:MAG: DUF4315 family protein [Clostridiales bacterium]|nr:DUF4315 family protein [Clostridiales bacterium]